MKRSVLYLVLSCLLVLISSTSGLAGELSDEPYPGYNIMQERFATLAQQAEKYIPKITTLPSGVIVQRTPSEYGPGVYHSPIQSLNYNNYYLNADNRGCTACHIDLTQLLSEMVYVHPDLRSAYNICMSIDQCISCHTYSPGYVTDIYGFGSMIHSLHAADRGFYGDCWSCHDASTVDGKMYLWDHVKYERLRGIEYVANVEGEFSFDQDVLTGAGQEFSYDWLYYDNDFMRYAARLAGNVEEDPEIFNNWQVSVSGCVDNPFTISLVDLIAEAPNVTTTMAIHCTMNPVGGSYISNCEITGIPLSYLLKQAGVQDKATAIWPTSEDGFAQAVHLSHLEKFDSYLVYEVNGQRLTTTLGYPLQLWTAGASAATFVKQLSEIVVVDDPIEEIGPMYLGWRKEGEGYFNKPNVAIFHTQEGQVIKKGEPYTFEGYAHAFEQAITAMQYSMDLGETWTTFDTPGAIADKWVYLFLASLKCSVPELNFCSTLLPVLAINGGVF